MSRLDEILDVKRREIEAMREHGDKFRRTALARTDFRDFRSALKRTDGQIAIIAEVKKASPSAGIIATSFDPVRIARAYESDGADAASVLTDEQFFQGQLDYLTNVRNSVSIPVLRKEFILDEVQIAESCAAGADAILLIVAALDQKQLVSLSKAATGYQLDALVEVHTLEELERALGASAEIIGINNRNLATFEVDLSVTQKLSEEVPDNIVLVSESGIKTPADVALIRECGVDAVLVGEALMRESTSIAALRGQTS
jgi:indole-3-glycerol phosphate synthase